MAQDWTYGENLEDSPRDLIRHLIGDTERTSSSPTDGEVDYWIGVHTNDADVVDVYAAAIDIARAVARKYRKLGTGGDVKIGGMSLKANHIRTADGWADIAAELEAGQNTSDDYGGLRRADNQPQSTFRIGMMDYGK